MKRKPACEEAAKVSYPGISLSTTHCVEELEACERRRNMGVYYAEDLSVLLQPYGELRGAIVEM